MPKLKQIDSLVGRLASGISLIGFVGALFIMVLNVVDVLLTKLFKSPIIGCYEITQYALLCTVFAVFAYGQTHKTHINMTIIITHLPRPLKFFIFGLLQALSTGIAGILSWAAFYQCSVNLSVNKVSDVLYIPIWPFMLVEGICVAVFTITLLWDTILSFAALKNDTAMEMITASWD